MNEYFVCTVTRLYTLPQEYGGLENAPEEIKATVVEMEQLTMSEASWWFP